MKSSKPIEERRKEISNSWSRSERAKRRAFSVARQTQLERLILMTSEPVRTDGDCPSIPADAADVAIAG